MDYNRTGLTVSVFLFCFITNVTAHLEKDETRICQPAIINCSCSSDLTVVNCSGLGLTYIPLLPNETTKLNMSGNSVTYLNQTSMKNTSYCKLASLDISKNNLSFIEEGSFYDLHYLENLNVSYNPVNGSVLAKALRGVTKDLRNLTITSMGWTQFPYNLTETLRKTRLYRLSLKNNSITSVDGNRVFRHLQHLGHLDLSHNSIAELKLSPVEEVGISHHLKYLSLSSNDLTELPQCCLKNKTLLPNLHHLFVDDNCIRSLHMENINCLKELRLLNISATQIRTIGSNTFAQLPKLNTITLEYTNSLYGTDRVKPHAFNSSSLKRLYIRRNDILFDENTVVSVFSGCPNVEKLDLSGNHLGDLHNRHWDALFSLMPKITYLDLSGTDTLYLPTALPKRLKNLTQFHFEYNAASTFPNNFFIHFEKLETLLLNDNKFVTVSERELPDRFTSHLKHLDMAYNPWECNCDLLWFIKFARRYAHKLYGFPGKYECAGLPNVKITDLNISDRTCLLSEELSMIISCTCISVMLLLFVLSLLYRWRWRLRYFIYILGYHRRRCTNTIGILPPHLHDVYISCSDRDFNLVYYRIVRKLEESFNVYYPERDAIPGRMKVPETLEKMDRSKCAVLCLSDSYAQDQWCEFEACMAMEQFACHRQHGLVVLVLQEISSVNMTKIFHKLMNNDEYIMWDENDEHNHDNWLRLHRQIRESTEIQSY